MAADKLKFSDVLTCTDHYDHDVTITKVTGPPHFLAYIYQCPLNVDWDGAAMAYGVNQTDPVKFPLQRGLNPHETGLRNAMGDDGNWAGVFSATESEARTFLTMDARFGATPADRLKLLPQFIDTRFRDGAGRHPVVQILPDTLAAGYYVSQCPATADASKKRYDQRRYIDAGSVAFGALSPKLGRLVKIFDFGIIIRNSTGASTDFFFGDAAGKNSDRVGECSGYVQTALAPDKNGEDDVFSFIVFPGSGGGGTPSGDAVERSVRNRIRGLAELGEDLVMRLAKKDSEQFFVRRALYDWGGPRAFPRDHGASDATDDYDPAPRTLTGY